MIDLSSFTGGVLSPFVSRSVCLLPSVFYSVSLSPLLSLLSSLLPSLLPSLLSLLVLSLFVSPSVSSFCRPVVSRSVCLLSILSSCCLSPLPLLPSLLPSLALSSLLSLRLSILPSLLLSFLLFLALSPLLSLFFLSAFCLSFCLFSCFSLCLLFCVFLCLFLCLCSLSYFLSLGPAPSLSALLSVYPIVPSYDDRFTWLHRQGVDHPDHQYCNSPGPLALLKHHSRFCLTGHHSIHFSRQAPLESFVVRKYRLSCG